LGGWAVLLTPAIYWPLRYRSIKNKRLERAFDILEKQKLAGVGGITIGGAAVPPGYSLVMVPSAQMSIGYAAQPGQPLVGQPVILQQSLQQSSSSGDPLTAMKVMPSVRNGAATSKTPLMSVNPEWEVAQASMNNRPPSAPIDEEGTTGGDDLSICVVCMDSKRDVAFVPCGHVACCGHCADLVKGKCPVCRATVTSVLPLHNA